MERKKVLIVDDDLLLHIIGTTFLNRDVFSIGVAQSGLEALEEAQRYPPDLVLLDHEMKEMDGAQICRELKSDEATRHIPIIIFGSPHSEDARQACLTAGCDAFLFKPLKRDDLIYVVEDILDVTQRTSPRVPVNLPATVRYHNQERSALISSLSISGAFITIEDLLRPGDHVDLTFTAPGLPQVMELSAEVMWVGGSLRNDATGAGVKFLIVNHREEGMLNRLISRTHEVTDE